MGTAAEQRILIYIYYTAEQAETAAEKRILTYIYYTAEQAGTAAEQRILTYIYYTAEQRTQMAIFTKRNMQGNEGQLVKIPKIIINYVFNLRHMKRE